MSDQPRACEHCGHPALKVCDDHLHGKLKWPSSITELDLCVACRMAYLEAQEDLLEQWQQRAEQAESAIAEIRRPLDEQMARLNQRVTEQNGELEELTARLGGILMSGQLDFVLAGDLRKWRDEFKAARPITIDHTEISAMEDEVRGIYHAKGAGQRVSITAGALLALIQMGRA